MIVQTKNDMMVLQLDKNNFNLVLREVESRTGVKIERLEGDK